MNKKFIKVFLVSLLCFMQLATITFADSNIHMNSNTYVVASKNESSLLKWIDSIISGKGSITIVCTDEEGSELLSEKRENLKFGTYKCSPPEIKGYTPVNSRSKSVRISRLRPNAKVTFKYKFNGQEPEENIKIENIVLSEKEATLKVGSVLTLKATIIPAEAIDEKIVWSSSNKDVASVDQYGKVTALKVGTTTIKVSSEDGNISAICIITVEEEDKPEEVVKVESVLLNITSKSIDVGSSFELTAVISPADAANKNVVWSTNNKNVTLVPNGLKCIVKGETAGNTVVTVKTEDGNYTKNCNVTVNAKEEEVIPPVIEDPSIKDLEEISYPDFSKWMLSSKHRGTLITAKGRDFELTKSVDIKDSPYVLLTTPLIAGQKYVFTYDSFGSNNILEFDTNIQMNNPTIVKLVGNKVEFTADKDYNYIALNTAVYGGTIKITNFRVYKNNEIEKPVDPIEPIDPVEPTDPVDPVDPVEPTEPDIIASELEVPELKKVVDDRDYSTSYFNYEILDVNKITSGTVYYLSPNGNDSTGDGTRNKPWKTINKVRTYVDNLSNKPKKVIILMEDGNYELTSTEIIKGSYFGTKNCPVEIRGIGNKARITTGSKLQGSSFTKVPASEAPGGKECYVFDLNTLSDWNKGSNVFDFNKIDPAPDYDQGKNGHTQSNISDMPFVSINGERLYVASYPNKNNVTELSGSGNNNGTVRTYTLSSSSKSILDKFTLNDSVNKSFIQSWWSANYYSDTSVISSYSNGKLTFGDSHLADLGSMNYPLKSKIYNVKEQLNEPSIYWIDYAKNKLYLIPPSGTDLSTADIMLSYKHMSNNTNERALIATNSTTETYVTFERITFSDHRSNVFLISNSNRINGIKFYRCRFVNIGRSAFGCNTSYGHYTSGGTDLVKNVEWRECKFAGIGEFGLYIVGGNRNSTVVPNDNIKVYNSTFKNIGCYGVYLTNYCNNIFYYGAGMEVKGNKFTGSPGITIRWRANDLVIEDNIFEDCVWADEDSGCVYMGNDWSFRGNKINYNIFRDTNVGSNQNLTGSGSAGIYCDDYSSGAEIIGNKISGFTKGIMMGGGRDSYIEGNEISDCVYGIMFDARGLEWQGDNLFGPVIFFTNSVPWESWRNVYPDLNTLVRMSESQANDRTTNAKPENNTIINNTVTSTKYSYHVNSSVKDYGKFSNNK